LQVDILQVNQDGTLNVIENKACTNPTKDVATLQRYF